MEVSKALEAMQYALQEDEYEGYRSRLNEASASFIRPLIAQLYLDVAMGNTDGPSYAEWTFLGVLSREELEDISLVPSVAEGEKCNYIRVHRVTNCLNSLHATRRNTRVAREGD